MPDFGDGSARDDYGALDPYAPSLANGGITPEQWAEYERKRKRARLLGYLGTIGGATALGGLSSALSGGGAAAGLPSGMMPGGAMLSTTFPAEGAAGTLAAGLPSGMLPGGASLSAATVGSGTAAGGTGSAAAGGGAAAGGAKGILGGLTARDIAALGLTGGSMIGSALQDKPNMNPTTATSDPNLLKLIQTMQGRLDQSGPLYSSILDMANGLLPTQYQKGGGGRM